MTAQADAWHQEHLAKQELGGKMASQTGAREWDLVSDPP